MSLLVNLRHLEQRTVRFQGELTPEELRLGVVDDLIQPAGNLHYDFTAARQERGLLLQGSLAMDFRCTCARCLKEYLLPVQLAAWAVLLPWEGEEAVAVHNDCVDLTPPLRDDMVLALPQRPLCRPECGGMPDRPVGFPNQPGSQQPSVDSPCAWRELDKLNL